MPKKVEKKSKDKEKKGTMEENSLNAALEQASLDTNPAAEELSSTSSAADPTSSTSSFSKEDDNTGQQLEALTISKNETAVNSNPPSNPDSIDTETLKDLLECPVCLRVPRSTPIYQCARGHVVCSECKPKVTTCPQCREVLGNIRSLVSEKVLEKLPVSCKYLDDGCQVEVMRGVLASHESSCRYRTVNCVDLACQQRVSLNNLLAHLDSDHETEDFVRVEGGEYSSHFIVNEEDFSKDIMWISDQLHFDGKYFYRECCRSNKGLWYIWVYELEPESQETSQYTCQISINSWDGTESLTCQCRPLSLDNTKEKIAESGRGLIFTDSTARLYWQENKVRYRVNITKKQN